MAMTREDALMGLTMVEGTLIKEKQELLVAIQKKLTSTQQETALMKFTVAMIVLESHRQGISFEEYLQNLRQEIVTTDMLQNAKTPKSRKSTKKAAGN